VPDPSKREILSVHSSQDCFLNFLGGRGRRTTADCTAPTPETLVDLDIAALLGYMPKVPPVKPPWFSAEFAEDLKLRAVSSVSPKKCFWMSFISVHPSTGAV
jgi:hypothetical protein